MSTTGTATPTKWKRTTQVSEGIMTEQSAYHSTLIIEITEFRFRFFCENAGKCIWLEDYASDVYLTDAEVLENLKLLFFNHPVLSLTNWQAIHVMVSFGAFTLIPEEVFRKEYAARYLELTQGHPVLPSAKTIAQHIPRWNCYNVFEMPQIWWDFFRDQFTLRDLSFSHISSILVSTPPVSLDYQPMVHVCVQEQHFIATIFEGNQLILCNRFKYQNPEEATFFYLSCLNELGYLTQGVKLVFSGEITPFSKFYTELSKFAPEISFVKKPEHLNYPSAFEDLADHRYFALLNANK